MASKTPEIKASKRFFIIRCFLNAKRAKFYNNYCDYFKFENPLAFSKESLSSEASL